MREHFQGLRVRVADGHRAAEAVRDRGERAELAPDRVGGRVVVQEHVAPGRADAGRERPVLGDGPGRRSAVQEHPPAARRQHLHQPVHAHRKGGEQAAHVVAGAARVRHRVQRAAHAALELVSRERGGEAPWPQRARRIGLHRQVDQHLLAEGVGDASQRRGVRRVRQHRVGDRAWQLHGPQALVAQVAEVVDDQGDGHRVARVHRRGGDRHDEGRSEGGAERRRGQ